MELCFNPLHCGAVVASAILVERGLLPARFNPLHCGAVVASAHARKRARKRRASFNPLHCGAVVASRSRRPSTRRRWFSFNPLHCGAVVASRDARSAQVSGRVSIPFIAGQWSLPRLRNVLENDPDLFQSPSLRGSGRFRRRRRRRMAACGFQSPSLRGSGRFQAAPAHRRERTGLVSIPFIAGQWSLRRRWSPRGPSASSFNPLHCGAVVASRGA